VLLTVDHSHVIGDGVQVAPVVHLKRLVDDGPKVRTTNVGIRGSRWKQALQSFTIYSDGRIPVKPATITYTDDRTLPAEGKRGLDVEGR
jgi:hypothetical protein